jgi:hypothetical protein
MEEEVLDGQEVLHCINCGASMFQENGINRITYKTAQKLADEKKQMAEYGTKKLCPRDRCELQPIRNDEAVPGTVTLLRCSNCRSIYAAPNELVLFKKAQEAKVEYFKIWQKPLPSIRSVVVLSFVALVAVSALAGFTVYTNRNTSQTQAEDVIEKINTSKSGRYVFMSFRTTEPRKSKILIYDRTLNTVTAKPISDKFVSLHYTTFSDLNTNDKLEYEIIVTDSKGVEIHSIITPFNFN